MPGLLTYQPETRNLAHQYDASSEASFKTYSKVGENFGVTETPEAVVQAVDAIKMLKNNVSKYLGSMFVNGCTERDVVDLFPLMEENMRTYQKRLVEKTFSTNHYWGDRKLSKAREIVGATLCQILESQEWLKFTLGRSGLKRLDHGVRKHLMPLYLNEALPENIRDMNYIYR